MMLTILRASIVSVALFALSNAASAASMQVAPTTVEILAGGSAATLNVKNGGVDPLKVQMRIYRWTLENGVDKLVPATDVVASPPIATIKPKSDYTVRVVRLSKRPVASEETYRIFVDEIPDPSKRRAGAITITARYSIPIFFLPKAAPKSELVWSQEVRNGKLYVSATNTGGRRVRVADLTATGTTGKPVPVAKGLAGYVLARQSKSWVMPAALQKSGQPLRISAVSEAGPIHAQAAPAHMAR